MRDVLGVAGENGVAAAREEHDGRIDDVVCARAGEQGPTRACHLFVERLLEHAGEYPDEPHLPLRRTPRLGYARRRSDRLDAFVSHGLEGLRGKAVAAL